MTRSDHPAVFVRQFMLAAALALFAAACGAPVPPATTTPTPTPGLPPPVVSTRLMAEVTGQLVMVGPCLGLQGGPAHVDYTLVWPPDFKFSLGGDTIQVTDQLEKQQVTLHLGDTILMAGGEDRPNDPLLTSVPANCPGPYWVVGSLPELVAPAAASSTATLTPAFTPSPPVTSTPAPSSTALPAATPTLTPPPGVTQIAQDGVITFTSTVLGVTFSYRPSQGGVNVRTFVSGDRVYVYYADSAATDGQYVQVFHKAPGDTLAQAIQKQILAGYDPKLCLISPASRSDDQARPPNSYIFDWIMPPRPPTVSPADDVVATQLALAQKCPAPYTVAGGEIYFMEDTRHPDRFFFFKIGQYWIYSAGPGEFGTPWQDTLRVIDARPAG